MFKGIIELEALIDAKALKGIRIVKKRKEQHNEAKIKEWNVYSLEVPEEKIKEALNAISGALKPDWYTLFWDETKVYFVFLNKKFAIPISKAAKGDYNEIRKYGAARGIQEEYINFDKEQSKW